MSDSDNNINSFTTTNNIDDVAKFIIRNTNNKVIKLFTTSENRDNIKDKNYNRKRKFEPKKKHKNIRAIVFNDK